jgi:hypothetical protein
MENITIKRLFQNIIILEYNDENIIYRKILKISFDDEFIERSEYEFNNYEIIMKTDYKCYFENFYQKESFKNITNNSTLNFNIIFNEKKTDIILNIIDILPKEAYYFNENKSYNMTILIGDYDKRKVTLSEFIKKYSKIDDGMNKIIIVFKKILKIINDIHENLYFYHSDFKLNNILILEEDDKYKIFLFDLEFSFYNDKHYDIIIIDNDYPFINNYLNCANNTKITNKFMRLFDYYILCISLFTFFNIDFIYQLKNELYEIIIDDKSFYLVLFYILIDNMIKLHNKNYYVTLHDTKLWHKSCRFSKIYNFYVYILNNIINKDFETEYTYIKDTITELGELN